MRAIELRRVEKGTRKIQHTNWTLEIVTFDESQLRAVELALTAGDRVITGGAGTGKTTIIKEIVSRLGGRAELMAPTGKAAARLREATGFSARTIHSSLMWDGTLFRRQGNFTAPVIIDEGSMCESWLLSKVIGFNPPKLILVGDASQLAPVGKGQPFHDLCALRPDIVSTLNTCHRAKGAVHIAAQKIRAGEAPAPELNSGGESWNIRETGGPDSTMRALEKWIRAGVYDPRQDIILSPQYGSADIPEKQLELGGAAQELGDGGIHSMNRLAKGILNPSDGEKFKFGDRVICKKNFGQEDLWNGDLGTVTSVDTKNLPWVLLDRDNQGELDDDEGEARHMSKEQFAQLDHAYALSVHKAQGSQFRRVFFVVFKRHSLMLSRSLIYTAITRAREGCIVLGESNAFYRGLNVVQKRKTVFQYLSERK